MRYAHLRKTSLLAAGETVSGFFSPRKSSGRIQGIFPKAEILPIIGFSVFVSKYSFYLDSDVEECDF